MKVLWMEGRDIPGYIKGTVQLTALELWWQPQDILDHTPWTPIVLVDPGFWRNSWVMRRISEEYARTMNVASVWVKKWDWWNTKGIDYMDHLTREKIGELKRYDAPIILLWHSMGGIVAVRVWANNAAVTKIIQLASPNNGTPLFNNWFLDNNQVAQQMRTWEHYADVQRDSNARKIVSVIAARDQIVPPDSQSSRYIPWGGTDHTVDADHFSILTDRTIIDKWMKKIQEQNS
jgi:predicted alpha/beta hydrolase family esterase